MDGSRLGPNVGRSDPTESRQPERFGGLDVSLDAHGGEHLPLLGPVGVAVVLLGASEMEDVFTDDGHVRREGQGRFLTSLGRMRLVAGEIMHVHRRRGDRCRAVPELSRDRPGAKPNGSVLSPCHGGPERALGPAAPPWFYWKLGSEVAGEIPGYPRGHSMLHLT